MILFNKKKVYCQTCGEPILDMGYISDAKRIYHSNQKCVPSKNCEDNYVVPATQQEIQQAILSKSLLSYGQLEKSVSK